VPCSGSDRNLDRRIVALLVAMVLIGCARLGPLAQSGERALSPAEGPWTDLAEVRPVPWFRLLNAGPEALEWRLRAIDSATRSIDLETFLWKPDDAGARHLERLLAAADRGVHVRLLLDDSFTMHQDLQWHAVDAHPNVELRIYNPFKQRAGGALLRELLNLGEFARLDHRLHNKILLVDGRLAIVGGRNIADEYFGQDAAFNFRDLDVMTLDGSTREMARHFDDFWDSGWTFPIERLGRPGDRAGELAALRERLVRVGGPGGTESQAERTDAWGAVARGAAGGRSRFLADPPARVDPAAAEEAPDALGEALLELVGDAEREVTIVSAYLIPTPHAEAVIASASARGVRVRLLTNSLRSNNHLVAHSAYRGHVERLIGHGAELHETRALAKDRQRYMVRPLGSKRLGLHAKALLVDDDHVYVGSCNLDPRSLNLNTEVGLLIEGPELNRVLREALDLDFHPRNAWRLRSKPGGGTEWIGDDQVLDSMPADSPIQVLEDWFLSLLPIEREM